MATNSGDGPANVSVEVVDAPMVDEVRWLGGWDVVVVPDCWPIVLLVRLDGGGGRAVGCTLGDDSGVDRWSAADAGGGLVVGIATGRLPLGLTGVSGDACGAGAGNAGAGLVGSGLVEAAGGDPTTGAPSDSG